MSLLSRVHLTGITIYVLNQSDHMGFVSWGILVSGKNNVRVGELSKGTLSRKFLKPAILLRNYCFKIIYALKIRYQHSLPKSHNLPVHYVYLRIQPPVFLHGQISRCIINADTLTRTRTDFFPYVICHISMALLPPRMDSKRSPDNGSAY